MISVQFSVVAFSKNENNFKLQNDCSANYKIPKSNYHWKYFYSIY